MRAAVATDIDRIEELLRKAKAAAAAENWNLTIATLRNASYDCLLISNTLTHIEPSGRVIDVDEHGSPALWNWH